MQGSGAEPSPAPEALFRRMLDRPEEEIDLAEAALLIAKNAYRDLDVPGYLARIGELAGKPVSYTHLTLPTILRV